MATISRPSPPALSPPIRRPVAPHPGLEVVLEPLRPENAVAQARRGLAGLREWAFWRVAFVSLCGVALFGTAPLYLMSLSSYLSTEGDNAIYIILAKALATGHGFTNIQGPTPRIESQYPFVFPLLLAPIVRFWGTDAVLQTQALVTAFALGSFVLAFCLFRRWLGSAILALAIVLASAASDLVW